MRYPTVPRRSERPDAVPGVYASLDELARAGLLEADELAAAGENDGGRLEALTSASDRFRARAEASAAAGSAESGPKIVKGLFRVALPLAAVVLLAEWAIDAPGARILIAAV